MNEIPNSLGRGSTHQVRESAPVDHRRCLIDVVSRDSPIEELRKWRPWYATRTGQWLASVWIDGIDFTLNPMCGTLGGPELRVIIIQICKIPRRAIRGQSPH